MTVDVDGTQTPDSFAETPLLVDPRETITQASIMTSPNPNEDVAMANSPAASSRSDTDMDTSNPESSGDQSIEIHEPSPGSHLQLDTSTQIGAEPLTSLAKESSELTHPSGNEQINQETANAAELSSGEKESEDSSDADISMQTSPAESSSDDESYEPQPAQISDTHVALPEDRKGLYSLSNQGVMPTINKQEDEEVVDTDPFEPSPVETDIRVTQPNLEDANREVVFGPF